MTLAMATMKWHKVVKAKSAKENFKKESKNNAYNSMHFEK